MNSVQVKFDFPEKLSRGMLLLKTFLGWLILIPHFICLYFLGIVAVFVMFISWFAVLFTGKYPKSLFDFVVGVEDWGLRVNAYFMFCDKYPPFGLKENYPVRFQVAYPEKLSRGILLLRTFLGIFYVLIPHGFCLVFRGIAAGFVAFIAWWAILFTGKFPAGMFRFISGTFRWSYNLTAYIMFLTDEYPPFTGKEDGAGGVDQGVSA